VVSAYQRHPPLFDRDHAHRLILLPSRGVGEDLPVSILARIDIV